MAQVLLVEPCDMVRQVNQLALRAWGTSVCAVKTEDEAISRLKLRGESILRVLWQRACLWCWDYGVKLPLCAGNGTVEEHNACEI